MHDSCFINPLIFSWYEKLSLFLQEWKKRETETKDSMLTLLLKVANKYVVSVIDDYAGERNSVALHSFGFEFFCSCFGSSTIGFSDNEVWLCKTECFCLWQASNFQHNMLQLSTPYISKIWQQAQQIVTIRRWGLISRQNVLHMFKTTVFKA